MIDDASVEIDRRTLLATLAGGSGAALGGCTALNRGSDSPTNRLDDEQARALATRFAPTLYFDVHEQWFPTDPRPYASERDGETVVDGFDAVNGYHEQFSDGTPPAPTVFYRAVEYDGSSLAALQFWYYSVFDQFTTNFHWHDWEVFHVFVDTETGEPQLYVASSHSRSVPNNEFLDPDPAQTPRILSELGSHSSTLSINEVPDRFQRIAVEDMLADVTNTAIEGIDDLANIEFPLAYGLPRDEGGRLPYLVPEYEGMPIYDHERLPAVTRDSLIDEALTIRSYDALTSAPTNLPTRETGLAFEHRERNAESDVEYELVPAAELEHIAAFTGPQLSFEFAVPDVIEDAMAGHITTTETPWAQPRYVNPAADISSPNHRAALAERYDVIGAPAPINTVVARLTEMVTTDDAPENEGLTTTESPVESVALLESEPTAVPTFHGVAAVQDVPAGDHRLTVNGAGRAPHSEEVPVADDGATTVAGVEGEIPLVAREHATKVAVVSENNELSAVALEDDFAGPLYESGVDGDDAVYVHDGGAYTVEVRDRDDAIGPYRVNPAPDGEPAVHIENPETGKARLSTFVADIAEETAETIAAHGEDEGQAGEDRGGGSSNAVTGLQQALAAVVEAARTAAERARSSKRSDANRQLETVAERLQLAQERATAATGELSTPVANAVQRRLQQATRRTEQARDAQKLSGDN